jgi:hypothetical protein
MRNFRGVLIGALTLVTLAAISPTPTLADPPASQTAWVMNGPADWYPPDGRVSHDAIDSVIGANFDLATGTSLNLSFASRTTTDNSTMTFVPPIGATLTPGSTYPTTTGVRDTTRGHMSFGYNGFTCAPFDGFFTLWELTKDPSTNQITNLAAGFSTPCGSGASQRWRYVDVRVNSTRGIASTAKSTEELAFGNQPTWVSGAERVVTFTANGTEAVVFGSASVELSGMFLITSDTCSGTTLPVGSSCSVGITPFATVLGPWSGRLKMPTNSAGGATFVALSLTGVDPAVLSIYPSPLHFGSVTVGSTSAPRTLTLKAVSSQPVTISAASIGGATPAAFGITNDSCAGVTLEPEETCTITVVAHPTAMEAQWAELVVPSTSLASPTKGALGVAGQSPAAGTYVPVNPSRILDTRFSNGASGPVGTGGTVHLQVAGRGGIPASGVSSVVLNVTVTSPTAASYVSVYPTGQTRPNASSLNFVPGWTGANSVTVGLGAGGGVDLFNHVGTTHLIADVVGYYVADNSSGLSGGELQVVDPERLFDSRFDWDLGRLAGGTAVKVPVSYGTPEDPDFYDSHIRALAVNITAVDGAGAGYLTSWSGAGQPPNASTLNFTSGAVVPNFAIVPTSICSECGGLPAIGIYTSVDVHVIVDVIGFYDDGQLADGTHDGLRFTPLAPFRIVDSRNGYGMPGALGQQATARIAPPFLPPATAAVALNITAVSPTATTFITAWPTGGPRPTVSTLNPSAGQIIPNAAIVTLGDGNAFNLFNNLGSVHIVVDQVGNFYYRPASSSAAGKASANLADKRIAIVSGSGNLKAVPGD